MLLCYKLQITNTLGGKMGKKNGLSNNLVTMSNQLCQASFSFSTVQHRIFESMLSMIDSRIDSDDMGRFENLELSAANYSKTFNAPLNHAYKQLSDAVDGFQFYIRLKTSDGKVRSIPFSRAAVYNPETATIEFSFHEDVIPFIGGLKGKFSSYRLERIIGFKSKWTFRIFHLLVSKATSKNITGELIMPVEELKKILKIENTYETGMVKSQILTKAKEELKSAGILFSFENIRRGRKTYAFKLSFSDQNPEPIKAEKNLDGVLTQELILELSDKYDCTHQAIESIHQKWKNSILKKGNLNEIRNLKTYFLNYLAKSDVAKKSNTIEPHYTGSPFSNDATPLKPTNHAYYTGNSGLLSDASNNSIQAKLTYIEQENIIS